MSTAIPDPPVRRAEIEMEVMPDGSALLYDPADDQGHVLTAMDALVWDMCDGTLTIEAIIADLTTLLPNTTNTSQVVHDLLGAFAELRLLATPEGSVSA